MAGRDLLAPKGRDLLTVENNKPEPNLSQSFKAASDTFGKTGGNLIASGVIGVSDLYSQYKEKLLDEVSDKGLLPTSDLGTHFGIDMKKVPIARTAASILTDVITGGLSEKAVNGGGALLSSAGKLASTLEPSLIKPNTSEVTGMIDQTLKESSEFGNVINRAQDADVANVNAKYTTLKNDIKTKLDTFTGKIEPDNPKVVTVPKLADAATINNRENYVHLAKDVSERFGEAYNKAVGDSIIDINDLHQALGNAVEHGGLTAKPEAAWSPAEQKVMAYYKSIGESLPGTGEPLTIYDPANPYASKTVPGEPIKMDLPVKKIDSDLQRILQSRAGKQYGSGDHILSLVREEMSHIIGAENPNIAIVRAKFKPLLQMKNEAFNIFQPFNRSGDFDTTRGINFFTRYVNGGLKPDEVRLVNGMKQKFGADVFKDLDTAITDKNTMIKNLEQLDQQHVGELQGVEVAHDQARAKTMMDTENHVSLLDSMLKDAQKDEAGKKLLKNSAIVGAKLLGSGALVGAGIKGGEMLTDFLAHK